MKTPVILFVFLLIFPLTFAEKTEIQIVTENWEDCTNEDETGLYFDILREVFTPEYDLKITFMPYTQSVKKVQDKKADLFLGAYIGEVDKVIYPKWHFAADDVTVVFLKSHIKKWNGEKSLKGQKVAWIRGYSYDDYLDVKMKIYLQDKRDLAFNLLNKKRVDFFIDNIYDIQATMEEMNLDPDNYRTELIKFLNLYFGFIMFPASSRFLN
ncbi:MAG: transporter substrate-binding domain-containing protein [Spirochaetales bacterium]|nr:transporter substrate-binding domain-containing protein [Spirochaetales bacterium]